MQRAYEGSQKSEQLSNVCDALERMGEGVCCVSQPATLFSILYSTVMSQILEVEGRSAEFGERTPVRTTEQASCLPPSASQVKSQAVLLYCRHLLGDSNMTCFS